MGPGVEQGSTKGASKQTGPRHAEQPRLPLGNTSGRNAPTGPMPHRHDTLSPRASPVAPRTPARREGPPADGSSHHPRTKGHLRQRGRPGAGPGQVFKPARPPSLDDVGPSSIARVIRPGPPPGLGATEQPATSVPLRPATSPAIFAVDPGSTAQVEDAATGLNTCRR